MSLKRIVGLCVLLRIFETVKSEETSIDPYAVTKFIETHFNDCVTFVGNVQTLKPILLSDTPRILYDFHGKTHPKMFEELGKSCPDFVVLHNDSETIETTAKKLLNLKTYRRRYRNLVVLREFQGETDVKTIFLTFWKYKIYNVVVYAGKDDFYTWYPYDEKNKCGNEVNLVKISGDEDPFEGKIPEKLHGCNLRFLYRKTWSIITEPSDKENIGTLNQVFEVLQKMMNIKIMYFKETIDYIDQFLEHLNYDELKEIMKKKQIDMAYIFQFMYKCHKHSTNLITTRPFLTLPLNFILPPREQKPIVIYVIDLFQQVLLVCVAATFLVFCILMKIATRKQTLLIALELLQLNLQQALIRLPSKKIARALLAIYLLYNICIYTAWQSGLSSSLTKPPRNPKIDTLKALAHSEMHVYAYGSFVSCSFTHRQNAHLKEILKKTHPIPKGQWTEYVLEFIKKPRNATIATFRALPVKNPEALQVITGETVNIFTFQVAAMPGFPLKRRMNRWIERMRETGLLQVFYDMARLKKMYVIPVPEEERYVKLTTTHLRRVFLILTAGLALATLILLAEMFVFHMN